jgi:hypothetical protein
MKWGWALHGGRCARDSGRAGGLGKAGVLQHIGGAWAGIGLLVIVGLGVMIAVSASGTKESIDIDRS